MACTPLLSEEDLYRFRTKQCLRLAKGVCEFGLDRCQYSHSTEWIRRCPYYISLPSYLRYIPVACPFYKNNCIPEDEQARKEGQKKGGSYDPFKGDNKEEIEKKQEILKHCVKLTNEDGSVNNQFYKYIEETSSSKCPLGVECPLAHSLDEITYHPLLYKTKRCERYLQANCTRYYCPDMHGLAEQRKTREYFIAYTSKVEIPPYPNVTVVNKIQYGSFKGQKHSGNKNQMKGKDSLEVNDNKTYSLGSNRGYTTHVNNKLNSNHLLIPEQTEEEAIKNIQMKRNTVAACNQNFIKIQNSYKKKKKRRGMRLNYTTNFDNKYSLYLHILKRFPHLFDLDISDINEKKEGKANSGFHYTETTFNSNEEGKEEYENSRYSTTEKKENEINEENSNNLNNQNNTAELNYTKEEKDHINKEDINSTNTTKDMKIKSLEKETEDIFMNNSYYDILNHIFKKNLTISKQNILNNIQKNDSFKITTDEKMNHSNYSTIGSKQEPTKMPIPESVVMNIYEHVNIENYDSLLNVLTNALCLLYFTTDSQSHDCFDKYAHTLAKQVHLECKKKRNEATRNYINGNVNELIQSI